jgi:hypothetical protein
MTLAIVFVPLDPNAAEQHKNRERQNGTYDRHADELVAPLEDSRP